MQRNLSENNLQDILKRKNDSGLAFTKDRDETLQNYGPHSTTSYGFRKKNRKIRFTEHGDLDGNEMRASSYKPKLTRVVYHSNKPKDQISNEMFRKPQDPIMTTTKYNIEPARNTFYPQKDKQFQQRYVDNSDNNLSQPKENKKVNTNGDVQMNTFNKSTTQHGFNRKHLAKSASQEPKTIYSTFHKRNKTRLGMERYSKEQQEKIDLIKRVFERPQEEDEDYDEYLKHKQDYNQNDEELIRNEDEDFNRADEEFRKRKEVEDKEYQEYKKAQELFGENEDLCDDAEEQAIIDSIGKQDWYKLLPDEILNNKNIDLDKFLVDNSEYFYNLICKLNKTNLPTTHSQNAQMKSTKPLFYNNDYQTAKLKYNSAYNTTYNKHFFKKNQQFPSTPEITDKQIQTKFLGQQMLSYQSQNKRDYKDHGVRDVERRKVVYEPKDRPFMGLTNYKSNFVDWKDYNQAVLKAPKILTTIKETPFFGKTSYNDAFGANQGQKGEVAEIDRKNLFKGPIPIYPFKFGETHYAAAYRPQIRRSSVENNRYDDNKNWDQYYRTLYSGIPSFKGQYKSQKQKDFGDLRKERYFGTKLKKVIRSKLLQKLEELREQRVQKELQEY